MSIEVNSSSFLTNVLCVFGLTCQYTSPFFIPKMKMDIACMSKCPVSITFSPYIFHLVPLQLRSSVFSLRLLKIKTGFKELGLPVFSFCTSLQWKPPSTNEIVKMTSHLLPPMTSFLTSSPLPW